MGLDLDLIYSRLLIRHYYTGNVIDVWVQTYASKEAFKENVNNSFEVEGIKRQYQFKYDRDRDGVDVLKFCHEKIKEELTTDVTEERLFTTIVDGEEKTEVQKVVIKEKFCEPEEIEDDLENGSGKKYTSGLTMIQSTETLTAM